MVPVKLIKNIVIDIYKKYFYIIIIFFTSIYLNEENYY